MQSFPLRELAAKALSERGKEVLDLLKHGTGSDDWMVRAGSTTALSAIIKQALASTPPDQYEAIKQQHADVIAEFVRLTADGRLEVRVAALNCLATVAPQTPAAAKAVLQLCEDPDDHLAQDAMIMLEKRFSIGSLEQDEVIAAFRSALGRSLPRGKSHIVRLIVRMKPEAQHQFVPDLLAHLDWKPMRDTMFGSGGQEVAIKLLTKMKERQLIERLPKLMGKFDRGKGELKLLRCRNGETTAVTIKLPAMGTYHDTMDDLLSETVENASSVAVIQKLSSSDLTDETLQKYIHHPDYGLRSMAMDQVVRRGKDEMVLPLLKASDPRLRRR